MRVPGTAGHKSTYTRLLLQSLQHLFVEFEDAKVEQLGGIDTKSYRHQSESWSSGRVHWLLSNSAYTGICESKPRQLEK